MFDIDTYVNRTYRNPYDEEPIEDIDDGELEDIAYDREYR